MAELLDLKLWAIVLLVSAVGVLAKLVYYYVGKRGKAAVIDRIPKLTPQRLDEIQIRYEEQGSRLLMLSSVPGIGSVLTAVAGIIGVRLLTFLFWVAVSALIRNFLLFFILGRALSLVASGRS